MGATVHYIMKVASVIVGCLAVLGSVYLATERQNLYLAGILLGGAFNAFVAAGVLSGLEEIASQLGRRRG